MPSRVEHVGDLRPAAMHDDRVDADLLQQHDVARERISAAGIAHRMPAIFDDEGLAGIAAHIGQRLGQDRGLDRRVGVRASRTSVEIGLVIGAHRAAHSIADCRGRRCRKTGRALRAIRRCRGARSALVRWISGWAAACARQLGGDAARRRGASSPGRACRSWSARSDRTAPAASSMRHQRPVGSLMPWRESISRQTRRRLRPAAQIMLHQPGPAP